MNSETLRNWIRPTEIDTGQAEGTTTAAAREIRDPKRMHAQLEQTIELLKAQRRLSSCGRATRR
jgi:transposase